jgi:hypothetical protein
VQNQCLEFCVWCNKKLNHHSVFSWMCIEQQVFDNHLMWIMGDDFTYIYVKTWLKQMDKFIHQMNLVRFVHWIYVPFCFPLLLKFFIITIFNYYYYYNVNNRIYSNFIMFHPINWWHISPLNLGSLIRYGIFDQYAIVDHNNVICELWSLDPKDGIEFLYHKATPLVV